MPIVWVAAETVAAQEIREWRRLVPWNMRGTIVMDQTIEDVTALAGKLRYMVSDMGSALALAEQLRLVRVGMCVSHPILSEKEKCPYFDDLGPQARRSNADVAIGMARKSATARPYSPQEVAVLVALFRIAAFQDDIVDCFLLLLIKQIEKVPRK